MQDLEQAHYTEIANKIEEYSDTDRAFMLWYLLQDYDVFIHGKTVSEVQDDAIDMKDYAFSQLLGLHDIFVKQLRDLLYHAIW